MNAKSYFSFQDEEIQTRNGISQWRSTVAGLGTVSLFLFISNAALGQPGVSFPTNGLVSWYQAESNSLDSVGGNNGVLEPGVGYAPGRVGSAFEFNGNFDGLSGAVNLGNVPDFDFAPSSNFTLCAWFDCFGTNAPNSNGGSQDSQQIVCLNYGCTSPFTAQALQVGHPGGPLTFLVRDANGNQTATTSAANPATNAWHLAVGVRDAGNQTVLLYLDGVPVATNSDLTTATLAASVNDFIGRRNACNSFDVFFGLIDDVMIYNRALSGSEVRQLYDYGTQISLFSPHIAGGSFVASVSGVVTNQTVVFQSSTNLANWNPFQTNIGTGGALNFTNLINPATPAMFFRAVVP